MNKILVFGAKGLLGSHFCSLYRDAIPVSRRECDITNPYQVGETLRLHKPDVVINCAGNVVKESPDLDIFKVNAYAPKIIAQVCDEIGARMIHVSTDCVFNGDRGNYNEDDYPTPIDVYGYSKMAGEVTYGDHLTVRSSFIGYPDPKRRSLLSWFSRQSRCDGWTKAYWNGLTTIELSRILMAYAFNKPKWNLVHVFGMETVSKYDILETVNRVYGWEKKVTPDPMVQINRTLDSVCWHDQTEVRKPFQQMVEEMRDLEFKFGY